MCGGVAILGDPKRGGVPIIGGVPIRAGDPGRTGRSDPIPIPAGGVTKLPLGLSADFSSSFSSLFSGSGESTISPFSGSISPSSGLFLPFSEFSTSDFFSGSFSFSSEFSLEFLEKK